VYGQDVMEKAYGKLRAVAAERVVEASDGFVIDLRGRSLRCLETPGHAKHHIAIHDEHANVCFTGDTFGLSYRELDTSKGPFILPTTTPVQFDPQALHASIKRLVALKPEAMYLTHYGRVENVEHLAGMLHEMIDAMVNVAHEADNGLPDRHARLTQALTELYAKRVAQHGSTGDHEQLMHWLGMDIELNAQGLGIWLDQNRR
jgi:glyoxylase-like metal-dependent hydrolase (beta-lactamase superfamily II)